ncbi:bacteriohemerythrin [Brachyspira alvinipulli]|uniref:bacteriohemerythrin n=1 Tax=Brachyspira alvinipulli TaxID=84379 RepID=UPI003005605A
METENKNDTKWIKWENKYKTGYKRIDDQHKELVDIINDLYSIGVNSDFNNEEVKKSFSAILKRAIDYATYHFSYEEKIMSAIDYSAAKDHITRHRAFSVKVVDEVNMYENGDHIVIEDFITFLRDWLINHIMVEDKKFITELKNSLAKICENEMQ